MVNGCPALTRLSTANIQFLGRADGQLPEMVSHTACPVAFEDPEGVLRLLVSTRDIAGVAHVVATDLVGASGSFRTADSFKVALPPGGPGSFDEHGVYAGSVVKTGRERVLYYSGRHNGVGRRFYMGIGIASWSERPGRWVRCAGPVLSANPQDPWMVSMPDVRRLDGGGLAMLYSSGQSWSPGPPPSSNYGVALRHSEDGLSWSPRVSHEALSKSGFRNVACPRLFEANDKQFLIFAGTTDHSPYRLMYSYAARGGRGWSEPRPLVDGGMASLPDWCDESQSYPSLIKWSGRDYVLFSGNGNGLFGFGIAELRVRE